MSDADEYRRILDAVMEQVPDGIAVVDSQLRFVAVSRHAEQITGRHRDALMAPLAGNNAEAWDLLLGDGRTRPRREQLPLVRAVEKGETVLNEEWAIRRADGEILHLLVNAGPIRDAQGRTIGAVNVWREVTDRILAERGQHATRVQLTADLDRISRLHEISTRLSRQEDVPSLLDEVLKGAIGLTGADRGVIQLVEPSGALRIAARLGFDAAPDPFPAIEALQAACGGTGGERLVIEDVSASPMLAGTPWPGVLLAAGVRAVHSTPLLDRTGAVVGVLWNVHHDPHRPDEQTCRLLDLLTRQAADLIERTRAEAALRESEDRYRRLVELSPETIAVHQDGAIVFVNPAGARLFGAGSPEEIVGRKVLEFVHPDDREKVRDRITRMLSVPGIQEPMLDEKFLTLDGSVVEVDVTAVSISYRGRPAVLVVARDISDRKRIELEREDLLASEQRARAEAEQANRAKDQFVALVSHELRNPLNAITMGVALLRRTSPADSPAAHVVDIVERNAKLQARLVNDLLDVSRLQRGKLALQRAPTRLDRICEGAIQSIESEAAAAGVAVGWTIEPDLWVLGDQDRLQQVLMNLLTNAVKFTRGPGRITLRAERAASEGNQPVARISVEDTGIGISPEMIPHLFEIFRQGEIAGTHAAGLGLGLSLVKGIVERHEGRAWAESAGVGKGSRFSIELPLMAPPAQGGPVPGLPEGAAAQAAEPGPPQRRSILLVEDNADTVTVLRESLEARGHEVHTAGSGESALEVLRKFVPDLILADIRLPGMDGYEFLARARQIPAVAGLPAFAVTAYGQEGDVRRAAQAGFMGHFTKPVDLSALDRRIRELPGRAYTRREAA